MMKSALTFGMLVVGWGCWPGGDTCEDACECRAAVNRCIAEAADDLRARASSDGAHFRDRADVLDAQRRPFSVPEDPTPEQLSACEDARAAHVEALRSFPELEGCADADEW